MADSKPRPVIRMTDEEILEGFRILGLETEEKRQALRALNPTVNAASNQPQPIKIRLEANAVEHQPDVGEGHGGLETDS